MSYLTRICLLGLTLVKASVSMTRTATRTMANDDPAAINRFKAASLSRHHKRYASPFGIQDKESKYTGKDGHLLRAAISYTEYPSLARCLLHSTCVKNARRIKVFDCAWGARVHFAYERLSTC